ncbi:PTS system mannose/fructose/sorbose family transporter subunit IID [Tepidanaerobacter acetatoxydans]|uniref:PTS system mannose/fructose/sorbose family transporter subunit IID n=1 Tax=Tepidanaerobacter acetatoxydans TaxID=499229 RepID=UPI001BD3D6D3|nr:PTS system mannose/fructose/sorbose family transporter subunit IID [Tepidanaerobacter acetatoxydans]
MPTKDNKEKRLTRQDIFKAWFRWQWFIESCPSWERLQASGFLYSISDALDKLYSDISEKASAFMRHLVFYNSQGNWGSIIGGIVLAMEEERANGAELSDEAINGLKTGLMGPLAGIGDTIDWGTLVPLAVSIGLPFAMNGNSLGSIIPFLLISCTMLGESYFLFFRGYQYGQQSIASLLESGSINKLIYAAGIVGMSVLGALTGSYVNLSTQITIPIAGGQALSLQTDVLDNILKGILPLGLVLFCWQMMLRKKKITTIMLYLLIIGIIGGSLYIF